jgi:hypothetical protein
MELIKLTDENIKMLEAAVEKNKIAQVAFQQASYLVKKTKDEIWDIIAKMFPNKIIKKGELKWEEKEILLIKEE